MNTHKINVILTQCHVLNEYNFLRADENVLENVKFAIDLLILYFNVHCSIQYNVLFLISCRMLSPPRPTL